MALSGTSAAILLIRHGHHLRLVRVALNLLGEKIAKHFNIAERLSEFSDKSSDDSFSSLELRRFSVKVSKI